MPNPIDADPDIAIGLSLPLAPGNSGDFNQTFTTIEQMKSNIKNLLLTMRGERPGNPLFGSDLHKILFEPHTEDTAELIKSSIVSSLREWLPMIIVEFIEVNTTNENIDSNRLTVTMRFRLSDNPVDFKDLTFDVESIEGG